MVPRTAYHVIKAIILGNYGLQTSQRLTDFQAEVSTAPIVRVLGPRLHVGEIAYPAERRVPTHSLSIWMDGALHA